MISKHCHDEINEVLSEDRILGITVTREKENLLLVNVYAPNESSEKITFYNHIAEMLNDFKEYEVILLGDFNCVLNNELDIVSGHPHNKIEIDKFNEALNRLGLYDAWRMFHPTEKDFTWNRFRPFIARRLDYCCVSDSIINSCVSCDHYGISNSDHKLVVLELNSDKTTRGPGYWKFNNSYLSNTEFVKEMNDMLDSFIENSDFVCNEAKWEICKLDIRNFCIEFGKRKECESKNEFVHLENQIKDLEKQIINNPHKTDLHKNLLESRQKLEILQVNKTRGAQVRARVKWIEEGEKNTKYFLNLEKARNKKKVISRLRLESGQVVTDQKEILQEQVKYYKQLYNQKTQIVDVAKATDDFITNENFNTLTFEDATLCEGMITHAESTNTLKQMKNSTAPGCDGLTTEFLKFFWIKIGYLVTASFNDSFNKGELSYTQRQGIITLLHKGNNREELKNWRPITLTNTDYKILAKVLAVRLGEVIQKLVSGDQVGYMKNRNIATVIRSIDDVINYINKKGDTRYLLALDYTKAFDSISKPFMLHAFKVFGFGENFQKWISVLTNNGQSSINHGGWISEPFNVHCGIRQGCPFSPLAFILAVELFAIKIRNSSINGINVPCNSNIENTNTSIKIKQYADDTTLFLKDKNDIEQALKIINKFKKFSGLSLNMHKTKALKIGRSLAEDDIPFEIVEKIKILGIHFQADKMAKHIEDNWLSRIAKIQRNIKEWEKRDLSIHGKIVIAKTFLISQIIFVMQSIGLPETVLKQINTILYKFLWQRKHSNRKAFEKVKRRTMESEYAHGGLKMINIIDMQKLFNLQWAGKLFHAAKENWSLIPRWHFRKIVNKGEIFNLNIKPKQIKVLTEIENEFWKEILVTYLENKTLQKMDDVNCENYTNQMLFNNGLIMFKNKPLHFQHWIDKGIVYLKDIIHSQEKRIHSLEEIERMMGRNRACTLFEYNALYNAIPKKWLSWIQNGRFTEESAPVCEASYFNTKPKEIKKLLSVKTKNHTTTPTVSSHWQRKFNFIMDKNTWRLSRTATKEVRLLELQWKINHNIYPTNIILQKMKVTDSNKCDHCPDKVDFLEHFFFHCPPVRQFWRNVEKIIKGVTGTSVYLTQTSVLFGVRDELDAGDALHKTNHILLIGKMCISIARKTNVLRNVEAIFENNLRIREKDTGEGKK